MKHRLLVLTRNQGEFAEKLAELHLPELEIFVSASEDEAFKFIGSCDVILANPAIARKYLSSASKLIWLQSTFAGVDPLVDHPPRTDYILTNVKETYGEVMSEYVFGYIFAFEREIFEYRDKQSLRTWDCKPFSTVSGKTLAILGTGSIGSHIAGVAKRFGMRTLGLRTVAEPVPHFDGVFDRSGLGDFLREADYVVSVLPSTPATRNFIDATFFQLMKPTATLINVGRGGSMCESDLISALRAGHLKRAVLDVFQEEPLPPTSPLWEMPEVFVTPHVSGNSISPRIFEIFAENYARFCRGEQLLYRVDFVKGY